MDPKEEQEDSTRDLSTPEVKRAESVQSSAENAKGNASQKKKNRKNRR
jgi:hypothetical protein